MILKSDTEHSFCVSVLFDELIQFSKGRTFLAETEFDVMIALEIPNVFAEDFDEAQGRRQVEWDGTAIEQAGCGIDSCGS